MNIVTDDQTQVREIAGVKFEPCARCGVYQRLVKVGKIWMQPEHERCGEGRVDGE